jgi:hypothetical protein
MSQQTTCAVFSCEELWLLQASIRHEMAGQDQWKAPPVSVSLNDQVADALVRCEEAGLTEAAIELSRHDCLAIDHCVPQGAKSASGLAIGKSVLMKSFKARRDIDEGRQYAPASEPEALSREDLAVKLEQWRDRRKRRRSA